MHRRCARRRMIPASDRPSAVCVCVCVCVVCVRLSSVGTAAHFSEPTAFLSHEGTNPQPSYPVHHASNVKQSSCPAPYYTQIPHDVSSLAAGATVPPNVMHLRSKGSVPRFRPRMRASPGLDLIMRCKEFRLALRHWMAQAHPIDIKKHI